MVIRIRSIDDRKGDADTPFADPHAEETPSRSRKPFAVVAVMAAVLAFIRALMGGDEATAAGAARAGSPAAADPGQAADLTMPVAELPPATASDPALPGGRAVAVTWAGEDGQGGPLLRLSATAGPARQVANDNGYVLPDARAFLNVTAQTGQPLRDTTLTFRDPPPPPPTVPPPVVTTDDTDCGCGSGAGADVPTGGTAPPPDRRNPPALEPVVIGTLLAGGAAPDGAQGGGTLPLPVDEAPPAPDTPGQGTPPDLPDLPDPAPVTTPGPAPDAPPPQDPEPGSPLVCVIAPDPHDAAPDSPTITVPDLPVLTLGHAADEVILGGHGDDTILGRDGADLILGGAGDDTLLGGTGADTLLGEAGDDVLLGDVGADELLGGSGADSLFGGAGDDLLHGGGGNDLLAAGPGADTVQGGDGDDHVLAHPDADADHLDGGAGDDLLDYGPTTADLVVTIDAGAGRIQSPEGSDSFAGFEAITAGTGDDHFLIGAGAASLRGAAGQDIFEFCLPDAALPDAAPSDTPAPAEAPAPLRFDYILDDFDTGDRMRLRHYDIVEEALDGLEDQFERIYGTEIDDDNLRLDIRHDSDADGPRTIITGTMDDDHSFTLTITLQGHRALALVEIA